jgi:hypothetical protein
MNRTRVGVFVLVCVAATLLVSSGSYAVEDADRGVDVGVADGHNGLLGVQSLGPVEAEVGESFQMIELTDNIAAEDVTVDSVSVSGDAPIDVESNPTFGTVTAECTAATDDTDVTLVVDASGDDVEVEKQKQVAVTCVEPEPEPAVTPTFNGCGTVDTNATVSERIYYSTGQGYSGDSQGKLVGVVIDGQAYENPNVDFETDNCSDANGAGDGVPVGDPPWPDDYDE